MSKKRIATSIQLLKPLAFVAERERERDGEREREIPISTLERE